MTTPTPTPDGRGYSIVRATVLGAVFGYLAGGLALTARMGVWSGMIYRFVWAAQGGRGETAEWGEPAVYAVLALALPSVWNLSGSLFGAAGAATFAARRRWEAPRALSRRYLVVAAAASLLLTIGVGGFVWVQSRRAKEAVARDRAETEEEVARQRALTRRAEDNVARDRITGYQRACALGEGASCFQVGLMYERSEGVARDFAQAAAFYRRACDVHYGMGCQFLGDSYMHGEGVARDEVHARALYTEAAALLDNSCAQGEAYSCYALGLMYRNGQGVAVDAQRARGLLDQGCRGGNNDACAALRASQ